MYNKILLPCQIDQLQLGLPSRDYFLDERSNQELMAYHQYMTEVSHLLGANESHAYEELWKVIEFEKRLANISVPEVERIDTSAIYDKISIADLALKVPQIN